MSSTDEDLQQSRKSHIATRMVTKAQEECHEARQQYIESRYTNDDSIKRMAELRFHLSVIRYYHELRTLRNNAAVEEFWEEAVLYRKYISEQLVDNEGNQVKVAATNDNDQISHVYYPDDDDPEVIPVINLDLSWEPLYQEITGLDTIEDLTLQQDQSTRTVSNAFGETIITEPTQEPLDGEILLSISKTLDEAAEKLGFAPQEPESVPRTKITRDMIEGVDEWRKEVGLDP